MLINAKILLQKTSVKNDWILKANEGIKLELMITNDNIKNYIDDKLVKT